MPKQEIAIGLNPSIYFEINIYINPHNITMLVSVCNPAKAARRCGFAIIEGQVPTFNHANILT
jgi:hypothetical protein